MERLLHLYLLWWLGLGHRLRHDLARELTFAVASGVLMATFFYVFNDFLNVQVATLSHAMHERFAQLASIAIMLISAASAATWLRQERLAASGVRQMGRLLGENQATLTAWSWLYALTLLGLSHGLCWWVIARWLTLWSPQATAYQEGLMLILTAVVIRLPDAPGPKLRPDAPLGGHKGLGFTLYIWRLRQLLRRNRASQLSLVIGAIFLAFVTMSVLRGLPLFVAAVSALAAGYTSTGALYFQLASDLSSAWTERGSGVTHDRFVRTYTWLGATLGVSYALGALLAYLAGAALHGDGNIDASTIGQALQVAAVALVPGLIAPMLGLQIDGRRSGTNLLLLLIATLFIGTAVFAHWLGLALIPILGSFALKSQAGRFYRA